MYIQYTFDQLYLPMDLENDIPSNHLVRVVNEAVNCLDDQIFQAAYHMRNGQLKSGYNVRIETENHFTQVSCLVKQESTFGTAS
ncbi:hypothetical protein [Paenibacillus sp. GCM10028914]|uniref:hypothetical protein n=1 Tax=Paenibacillus sp. GCM10028914 TaxID=3273416 RepID=UPI003608BB7B